MYLELKTHGLDGDPKYLGVPIVFSFVGCVLHLVGDLGSLSDGCVGDVYSDASAGCFHEVH